MVTSTLNSTKEPKSKKSKSRTKTSPDPQYDFSEKNIDLCFNTLVAYLKSVCLTEKANVIEQTYKNHSDKVAVKLNNVLENKKTKENIIPCEQAAAITCLLYTSPSPRD